MAVIIYIACLAALVWGGWRVAQYRRGQLDYPHGNERRRRQLVVQTHSYLALAGGASAVVALIFLFGHKLSGGAGVLLLVLGALALIGAGASIVSSPTASDWE
ncbi:MAG TPA: hypothetical protein VKV26_10285 [Dehalococcoidia bacterium]|nr:hypothetical protein [Dehalococcoidia bacterium]